MPPTSVYRRERGSLLGIQSGPTARAFLAQLRTLRPRGGAGAASARVPMRDIFALAKEFIDLPPPEIEVLLDRKDHGARVGAVSIMDWQARRKSTPPERRRELFDLYVRRHDRIDNWDLVDRSAPSVVGGYLFDRSRDQLYRFARSKSQWERRSAIVATYYFIRKGDLEDTFAIAEILIDDESDLVQRAVGGWVREAGKRDPKRLRRFLDRHAASMPRTMLRYAIGHLDAKAKRHYLGLRVDA